MTRALILSIVTCLIAVIVFNIFFKNYSWFRQTAEVIMITAFVPGCGNNVIEFDEECDGSNLAGASCQSKNFLDGKLSCTKSCLYNVTACTNADVPSGVTNYSQQNIGTSTVSVGSSFIALPENLVRFIFALWSSVGK